MGTTNESEAMSGFAARWGDSVVDAEPILPLKAQVCRLVSYLGIPERKIKAPSPELLLVITGDLALGITVPWRFEGG